MASESWRGPRMLRGPRVIIECFCSVSLCLCVVQLSECHSDAQLHHPRVAGREDLPDRPHGDVALRIPQIHEIERVERLDAKLQSHPVPKRERPEQREIDV